MWEGVEWETVLVVALKVHVVETVLVGGTEGTCGDCPH